MEEKIEQQKQLIIKAKDQIDRLKKENQFLKSELQNQKERNDKLEQIVTSYLKEEQTACERVLARIKIDEIEWVCIKTDCVEWIRESEFITKFATSMLEQVQQLDYQKSKDDIVVVIQQYEQRVAVIQKDNEHNEQVIANFKELLQQQQDILSISEALRENCLLFQEQSLRQESESKIKSLLFQLQKFSNPQLMQLKSHFILIYQTIYEILRNHIDLENIQHKSEAGFKQQLIQLEEEKLLEQQQKLHHFETGRAQILSLEQQISEMAQQIKDKNNKIHLLQEDSKQNVNIQYIKNIIIRFFTEEHSVKAKTIPVIGTVLQFTEGELKQVQEAFSGEQGVFQRLFRK